LRARHQAVLFLSCWLSLLGFQAARGTAAAHPRPSTPTAASPRPARTRPTIVFTLACGMPVPDFVFPKRPAAAARKATRARAPKAKSPKGETASANRIDLLKPRLRANTRLEGDQLPDWRLIVPNGRSLSLTVSFDAAWETELRLYQIESGRNGRSKGSLVRVFNNLQGAHGAWRSGINRTGRSLLYGISVFHKESSPTEQGPPGGPWIRSVGRRRVVIPGQSAVYEFEDGVDQDWNDTRAVMSIEPR
jgi:hypothetical protein